MELNDLLDIFPSVKDFEYELPPERIATHPMDKRDDSRLLVYKNEQINNAKYYDIDQYLSPGSLLVFNNTRAVQARLHFKTSTGANVEIFCLEPQDIQKDVAFAMQSKGGVRWKCLVGELRKWKDDQLHLHISNAMSDFILSAKLIQREEDAFIIEFTWTPPEITFAEILESAGRIPLPPYIKRELTEADKQQYQTVYALREGSVAAPTAGLHFTKELLATLEKKKIDIDYLTLHVGAGTFKPIKSQTIAEHDMHSEQFIVERRFVERLIDHLESEIVAVGTTSLRTIESLYWLGVKILVGGFPENDEVAVKQWDPYLLKGSVSAKQALEALLYYLQDSKQDKILTRTQILIIPGYQWKLVNVLATNFHQPKSTLIMLVASFIGNDWKKVYSYAMENNYRFLSYGDGSLLFRK